MLLSLPLEIPPLITLPKPPPGGLPETASRHR
nr:MAG TPA: hypothetical protein [Caudoviricetes sp.]